jgi:hypothetical protein
VGTTSLVKAEHFGQPKIGSGYLVQELKTILAFCDHTFLRTFLHSFIITSSFMSCIHILLHSINHVAILLQLSNAEAFSLILQEVRWKGDCQSCKIKKKTSFFAALESRQIGIVFITNLETSDPTSQVSGIRNVCY